MSRRDGDRLVYSSGRGRVAGPAPKPPRQPRGDGIVRVRREVKGRRGKGVTVVEGVPLDEAGLRELASELKRRFGGGGSVVDGRIELQGDHRDALLPLLEDRGWRVRKAGG